MGKHFILTQISLLIRFSTILLISKSLPNLTILLILKTFVLAIYLPLERVLRYNLSLDVFLNNIDVHHLQLLIFRIISDDILLKIYYSVIVKYLLMAC